MKSFDISLVRTYQIKIRARSRGKAKRLTEFFIGKCVDDSTLAERKKYKFSISNIELIANDAIDLN